MNRTAMSGPTTRIQISASAANEASEPAVEVRGALAGLSLAMLMPAFATSAANAALPTLAASLGVSFQAGQWIVLAYLLATTVAVVVSGKVGDHFGRRRLLLGGVAIFTGASFFCAVADTLPILIVARSLQGLGAAAMMALATAFVGDVVPRKRMGQAMGLLGTMSATGTTLGPPLGGILIALVGWPAIFLINIPLGGLTYFLIRRALPVDKPSTSQKSSSFDFAGVVLLILTLGSYALAVTVGRGHFDARNGTLMLVAIGAGICFVVVQTRAASPLIGLGQLRNPVLATGLVTNVLVSSVMMATLIVGPFYLSKTLRLDAAAIGIVLSAGPLAAALFGIPAGRIVDRFGVAIMLATALFGMLIGAVALSVIPESDGIAGYMVPIVLMTSGYAIFQAANNTVITEQASAADRGLVSGLLALSRNLGLVTGASVMGAVFVAAAHGEVVNASPQAIATGTRATFTTASVLILIALLMTFYRQRRCE